MLSKQQLAQYDRDGIVFPIKVLADDEVSVFRGALDSLVSSCEEGSVKRLDSLHLFFDWARCLVTHEALLDSIEDILGRDILVYGTLVFYKPAHDSSYASWHQDSVYSGLHLSPSTSAWIALTPSHQANGCMRVIAGSHKLGSLNHVNVSDPNLLNRRGERIDMAVDESQAVDVVLRPGEMSLHHSNIVHGSNPNASDEPRIGFIVRFVTSQFTNKAWPLLRVRGDGDCSHLKMVEQPRERDRQSAFAAWQAFTNARNGQDKFGVPPSGGSL
jgi:ectoine hydroxylase-related dioxygenase (phytanoyl-CoA dioxygenase family)